MANSPQIKIAIVGAGPVSLALANILQNNDIPFTVFEAANDIRGAGGSLDLHAESGQLALKEANLWEAFMKYSRPESDCDKIKQEQSGEDKFSGRPEIDRKLLLKILSENLRSENIKLGMKLHHVTPSGMGENKFDLHFADGTQQVDFDLVIGGDCAWSKVRSLLTDIKPAYSGISMVEVNLFDIQSNPWLVDFVGIGSMFSFGEGRAVLAQRQSDGSLRTYACLRVPEDFLETCGIDWKDQDTARKQYVERYFADVGEDLKRVVLDCKDNLIPRPLFELPVGFTWPHRAGVTLIGDAAHVMTPFAGVGVNVGMTDALVLGREIIAAVKGEKKLDAAVQAYENEMLPRAEKYMKKTEKGKIGHFSADGSRKFADMLKEHHR
ncbi:hypothetical protein ACEQ8H_000773 [Pleosporales sp. CAS-2024a]